MLVGPGFSCQYDKILNWSQKVGPFIPLHVNAVLVEAIVTRKELSHTLAGFPGFLII